MSALHEQLRHTYNKHTVVGSMANVINWSGLCTEQECLTNAKGFSKFRYFKFSRESSSTTSSKVKTTCFVRYSCTDEWENISKMIPNNKYSSFIKFAPDLKKTPPLIITCPDGKQKVTDCLEAAENRIDNETEVNDLLKLRDSVFRSRTENFHWDLNGCIEISQNNLLRFNEDEEDIEEEQQINDINETNHIRQKICYTLNSFVAVKPHETTKDKPFWVGKINQVELDDEEIPCSIEVHWYDVEPGGNVYHANYYPVFTGGWLKTRGAHK